MTNLPTLPNATDEKPDQINAREHYEQLRTRLVALQSVSEDNAAAIDAVIQELILAQRRYKATHGLVGNNPIED